METVRGKASINRAGEKSTRGVSRGVARWLRRGRRWRSRRPGPSDEEHASARARAKRAGAPMDTVGEQVEEQERRHEAQRWISDRPSEKRRARREDQSRQNDVRDPDAEIAKAPARCQELKLPTRLCCLPRGDDQQAGEGYRERHGTGATEAAPLPLRFRTCRVERWERRQFL